VGRLDALDAPTFGEGGVGSFLGARLGPWAPGSSSLKHSKNNRPPGFTTVASPLTQRRRSSSLKTWNNPESITVSNRSDQSLSVKASMTRKVAVTPRSAAFFFALVIGSARESMPVTFWPRLAKKRAFSPVSPL
jgi:hypothetical protein